MDFTYHRYSSTAYSTALGSNSLLYRYTYLEWWSLWIWLCELIMRAFQFLSMWYTFRYLIFASVGAGFCVGGLLDWIRDWIGYDNTFLRL